MLGETIMFLSETLLDTKGIQFTETDDEYAIFDIFKRSRPHLNIFIETPKYILKTANTFPEFKMFFSLRHSIFTDEYGAKTKSSRYDFDEYDALCDHLIIIDRSNDKICGYYRMISDVFSHSFYSESEFNIDKIKELNGNKLELGRACIAKDHRNGQTISLLWKGIGEYAKSLNCRYIFGLSSLSTDSLLLASAMYFYFENNNQTTYIPLARAKGDYKVSLVVENLGDTNNIDEEIPNLLKMYIAAGSKIVGYPAYDRDFNCFDFLTMLDLNEVSASFKRRYFS